MRGRLHSELSINGREQKEHEFSRKVLTKFFD